MVTMRDIAEKCGVSIMTVSRVLNEPNLVSDATKELILEACESLGYIPNSAAKALVTKETNMIGLVVPDVNYYYTNIIKSITLTLESRGYGLLLCPYDHRKEKEAEYLSYLLQGRIDGIILFPSSLNKDDYVSTNKATTLVVANRIIDGLDASSVSSDNYAGSVKIMEHILSKGYKRVGAIRADTTLGSFNDRLRGYKDVLFNNGIEYDESIVCASKGLFFHEGYTYAEQLISKGVDSIFAFNDMCALGVLKYCSDNAIAVPGDIGVAGFDNIQYLELFDHGLTTVDYNGLILGEQVSTLILNEISNPDFPKRSIVLDPELIIRKTV